MPRSTALLFLTLLSCRPAVDVAPTTELATSDVMVEEAMRSDAMFAEAPPTMEAAEAHALRLAELSHAASSAPSGRRHPHGVRRLAVVADLTRDELLACRSPIWELREPPESASLSTSAWLHAHQRMLRRGVAEGWTPNTRALHAMLILIDERMANGSDRNAELYVTPPMREHRAFLLTELQSHARPEIGLAHLPLGRGCFEARARLLVGRAFDEQVVREAAAEVIAHPRVLDGVDLHVHPATQDASSLSPIWRPNTAVARGAQLAMHTRSDRRGAAIVAAVAVGAFIDLALHADGDVGAVDRLRLELPWIPGPVFAYLLQQSAIEPLRWLSTFEGYRVLERQRGGLPAAEFDAWLADVGALEPDLLALEFRRR